MAGNVRITNLITAVLATFWAVLLLLGAGAWWALNDSGKSLHEVHDRHMARAESLAQMALAVEGTRLEIMRAFQHDPASPLLKLHDHPIESHFKAAQARDEQAAAVMAALEKLRQWHGAQAHAKADAAAEQQQQVGWALPKPMRWPAPLHRVIWASRSTPVAATRSGICCPAWSA